MIKKVSNFCSHCSVFLLEKQPKNLNFYSFFAPNRPFVGYFQWNVCTYFQKICNWARYSDAKLIKNILNFLVALLRFFFTKATYKSKFSPFFLPLINPLVVTFNKRCAPTSRKCRWTRYIEAKLIKKNSNFVVGVLRFSFRKTT